MIKKLILAIFMVLAVNSLSSAALAQSTKSATSDAQKKDIETLKDKIADRVAELSQKDNKAYAGFIEKVDGETIRIKSTSAQTVTIKVDDILTKYFQIEDNAKEEVDFKDLEVGDYIIVSGPRDEKKVNANFIYIDTTYEIGSGKVTEVNSSDNSLRIVTLDRQDLILDIEVATSMQIVDIKSLELSRVGFSKIKNGDTVHFVFKKSQNPSKNNTYPAQKIILIPQEFFDK